MASCPPTRVVPPRKCTEKKKHLEEKIEKILKTLPSQSQIEVTDGCPQVTNSSVPTPSVAETFMRANVHSITNVTFGSATLSAASVSPPTAPLPDSIYDLCTILNLNYMTVCICCLYCRRVCTPLECLFFDHGACKLIYEEKVPYAACHSCLLLTAKLDFLMQHNGTFFSKDIEKALGIDLAKEGMRCLRCMRLLDGDEIKTIVFENDPVFCIGDRLRARCVLCKLGLS